MELLEKISNMKIELIALDDLQPDPMNTKFHPQEQIDSIAAAMQKRWTQPILIDENNLIIAGHGRQLAGRQAGYTHAPCIRFYGVTEAERIELQIFDNKSAEGSEWDMEKLQAQLDRLLELGGEVEATGWTLDELEEALDAVAPSDDAKESDYDKLDSVPEMPEFLKSRHGDIWILGSHRLMCGDSTSLDDVNLLMQHKQADMVFTDPPYGVSYKGTNNPNGREWQVIKNDNLREDGLYLFLAAAFKNIKEVLKHKRAFYIWYANSNHMHFERAILDAELRSKQIIIWQKGMVLGHSDYHWAYEPCFYGTHNGESAAWFGDRTQKTLWAMDAMDIERLSKEQLKQILTVLRNGANVWEIKRDAAKEYIHPTQKPVQLAEKALINSSARGEVVLDLFGGSGSTLIACENRGRKSRLMELDPKYCDLIVRRWQETFGGRAKRENDGISFDEADEYQAGCQI